MPDAKVQLLIVDDEPSIRTSLSQIFVGYGHSVQSAADGFSALRAIRQGVPDILLSDLNMPGMSGFELLSVVRRRFPTIQTIAMSGAYTGNGIPPGVAADFFYEKGSGLDFLLQIVETMTRQRSLLRADALAPIWIAKNGHDPSGEAYVTITCPECLRTFAQVLDESISLVQETSCSHCSSSIEYAIVQPSLPQDFQWKPGTSMRMPPGVLHLGQCEQE